MSGDVLYGISVVVKGETLGAERYALVKFYVIAYNTRCTDYNTRAVVNREMRSDLCGGVNVNARFTMCHFGDDTRNEGHVQLM